MVALFFLFVWELFNKKEKSTRNVT